VQLASSGSQTQRSFAPAQPAESQSAHRSGEPPDAPLEPPVPLWVVPPVLLVWTVVPPVLL
jgi:hypothetical protein